MIAAHTATDQYWLGASELEQDGTWKWEDGSEWTYTHWHHNQPDEEIDGSTDLQKCLVLR